MHGNIDRLQAVSDDSLDIILLHIGQCNIISLQKRKPGIIVLKIQRIAHSFRHLIDKTKDAFIPAGLIIIHQSAFKHNAQIFVVVFFDFKFPFFPVRFSDQNSNFLFMNQIMIIKHIFDLLPVDTNQRISGRNVQFICDAALLDFIYDMLFFHS